jgi:hypothetical protein
MKVRGKMNRLEMAAKLFENPKREAKDNKGNTYMPYKENGRIEIINKRNKSSLSLTYIEGEAWEIIEPERKLKEFDFAEAYYIYRNIKDVYVSYLQSVKTGKRYKTFYNLDLDVLKGKWTIDGYYEEDD